MPFEFIQPDVFERKLDRALRDSFSESFYYRKSTGMWSPDEAALWTHFADRETTTPNRRPTEVPLYWPSILHTVLSASPSRLPPDIRKHLRRGLQLTVENLRIQTSFCLSQTTLASTHSSVNSLSEKFESVKDHPILHALHDLSDFLTSVIEAAGQVNYRRPRTETFEDAVERYARTCRREYKPLRLIICWSQHLALIKFEATWYMAPRDSILMLQNKCADLISVFWYTSVAQGNLFPNNAMETLILFLKRLCNIGFMYQTKSFTIFKTLEALGIRESLVELEQ